MPRRKSPRVLPNTPGYSLVNRKGEVLGAVEDFLLALPASRKFDEKIEIFRNADGKLMATSINVK